MTIASALTALNTDIQNARTAITNKGGTVTVDGGSSQLANDIGTITELKGETKTINPSTSTQTIIPSAGKNGITSATVNPVTSAIDANIAAGNIKKDVTILGVTGTFEGGGGGERFRVVDGSGNLVAPSNNSLDLSNVVNIPDHNMYYMFYNSQYPKNVDLRNLTTVGRYGLSRAFNESGVESINLTSLTTVDNYGLYYSFDGSGLTTLPSFTNLTSVGAYGFSYAFANTTPNTNVVFSCTSVSSYSFSYAFYQSHISSVTFPNLENVNSSSCFNYAFYTPNATFFKFLVAHMFPKLKRISGSNAFSYAFGYSRCRKFIFDALEDIGVQSTGTSIFSYAFLYAFFKKDTSTADPEGGVYFPVLHTIGTSSTTTHSVMSRICSNSNSSAKLGFPELTTVYNPASNSSRGCFYDCGAISVYMPKVINLGTYNQYCFNASTTILELHFGKENQSTIQGMSGYGSKFGATNATIYFDLINHITVGGVVYDRYGKNYDYDNEYYSWKNGDNIIYTTNQWTPVVGDTVYTKSGDTYTPISNTITAVS